MTLNDYLNLRYPVSFRETEDGRIEAWHPDFGHGTMSVEEDTLDLALEELNNNRADMIRFFHAKGFKIPLPNESEEEDLNLYSGKFNLRISRVLHKELVVEAKNNNVSLNSYVGELLAKRNEVAKFEKVMKEVNSQKPINTVYQISNSRAIPGELSSNKPSQPFNWQYFNAEELPSHTKIEYSKGN